MPMSASEVRQALRELGDLREAAGDLDDALRRIVQCTHELRRLDRSRSVKKMSNTVRTAARVVCSVAHRSSMTTATGLGSAATWQRPVTRRQEGSHSDLDRPGNSRTMPLPSPGG